MSLKILAIYLDYMKQIVWPYANSMVNKFMWLVKIACNHFETRLSRQKFVLRLIPLVKWVNLSCPNIFPFSIFNILINHRHRCMQLWKTDTYCYSITTIPWICLAVSILQLFVEFYQNLFHQIIMITSGGWAGPSSV